MQWEVVIGLEVHTQLSTRSKIFSAASTAFGAAPNTQASAVDIALPGVLPVLNRGAVERAIRFGLAINARINRKSVFARKNYFYPDLPKGYQISQFELPVVEGGHLGIQLGHQEKIVRITRAHLEEDAGKSLHEGLQGVTGIDLNRAGTPLLEIVSEPDMRSAEEAVAYARKLHGLVTWIGICDGNMQEGSFRVDANVSVRPHGQTEFGTRREIKNLNSFKFMEQAINYEVRWQIGEIEEGRKIQQATVLFDADSGETRMMRSKEDAHDYRYFPDPDLPPLLIDEEWIAQVRSELPELPEALAARWQSELGLTPYDAQVLTASKASANYYTAVLAAKADAKLAANWIMGEVATQLNREEKDISACPVEPVRLAGLILKIQDGTISNKIAKDIFRQMWESGKSADTLIEEQGLQQVSDSSALEAIIDTVLAANTPMVAEYRAGKEKVLGSLVGQCMKASAGRANPALVNELLRRKLSGG